MAKECILPSSSSYNAALMIRRRATQLRLPSLFESLVAFALLGFTGCESELPEDGARMTEGSASRSMESSTGAVDVTESFSEKAGAQLKKLGKVIEGLSRGSAEEVVPLLSPDFRCGNLRPANVKETFKDRSITVLRGSGRSSESGAREGAPGLLGALRSLVEPMAGSTEVRTKFKVVRVELGRGTAETVVFFTVVARKSDMSVEQNATWTCRWTGGDDGTPRIAAIQVEDHEEVVLRGVQGRLFADCTDSALRANPSYREHILVGHTRWTQRLQTRLGVDVIQHTGMAMGDANADGLDDLYLCQPGGLPNRLFLHQPDGSVVDRSAVSGVDFLDLTRSALFLDFDADGDQDLVLGFYGRVSVFLNDGNAMFSPLTSVFVDGVYSLSAADHDADGWLDLFVCSYPGRVPSPIHHAANGHPNTLLRNVGGERLVDVSRAVGLHAGVSSFSLAASWEDFDDDGDPDLYVANDFGPNNLYRNEDGRFVDIAAEAGVEDIASGMGVAWADYNRDGRSDLHVSNMFSSAGNRVAYQRQFHPAASEDTRAQFQRHARGNSLFENLGDGKFADVSVQTAITMGRWAWDSKFVDINNDGWEDLLVANGYITQEDTGDL